MVTSLKSLLEGLIKQNAYKKQFNRRKEKYSHIEKYLPDSFEDIITDSKPWYHHGLGFRLATFPNSNEIVFKRLNCLLKTAESLDGWENESNNIADWSLYDKFFQHLWMLQCIEYYIDQGFDVCFPGKQGKAAPDLKITKNNETTYVECYVYSKWWFTESFIEEIIGLIDLNLRLKRVYNLKPTNTHNGMSKILEDIGCILEKSKLEKARTEASAKSPCILYDENGIKLIMEGTGEYQASDNAHGDPERSAQPYIDNIIDAKRAKNDLKSHRPNLLMVNALGTDFQNIFPRNPSNLSFDCSNIDKLEIYSCGIDEQLTKCSRRLCILPKNRA